MEPVVVFLNARAGRPNSDMTAKVRAAFNQAGCDVVIRPLEGGPGQVVDAIGRADVLAVAAGGDEYVSTVASALVGSSAALGVLPLGTLNHFAKDLGMPLDLTAAVHVLVQRQTALVDVGEVNGHLFVNNSSIGMYARLVVERDALQRDGRRKWIAHGAAALRVWRDYRWLRVSMQVDDAHRRVRTPFVFVGNNEYRLRGFELGGRETLRAGHLQVCLAPGISRAGVAGMIGAAMFGRLEAVDLFESVSGEAVVLDAGGTRIEVSLDGEVVMLENPLTYRIRRRALRVVVPDGFEQDDAPALAGTEEPVAAGR